MSATDILRHAENNALRVAQAPHLAYELAGAGGYGNIGLGSGDDFVEHDGFLENSNDRSKGFYRGNDNSDSSGSKTQFNFKSKQKGKLKKTIAGIVIGTLIGGATFLGSSNTILPQAMLSQFNIEANPQETSLSTRFSSITGYLLKKGGGGDGATFVKKYQLTPELTESFTSNGFVVNKSGSQLTLTLGDTVVDGNNFRSVYNNNVEFRDAYSKSVNPRANSFFDKAANAFYQLKLKISRNIFKDYKETSDPDANKKLYNETRSKSFDGDSADTVTAGKTNKEVQEVDENGPITNDDGSPKMTTVEEVDSNSTTTSSNSTKIEARSKARSYIEGVASKVSGASLAAGGVCMLLKTATAVSLAISAMDMYQSIRTAMQIAESPSKAIAGEGETSAIHETAKLLTEPAHSETSDLNNITINGSGDNITTEAGIIEENKAPIESEGFQLMLAGAAPNKQKVDNYSIEKTQKSILSTFASAGMNTVNECAMNSLVGGIASIAVTLAAGPIKITASYITKTVATITASVFLAGLISFLIPKVADMFSNPVENLVGVALGEEIPKGIAASNFLNGQVSSANGPTNAEEALAYNRETETRLALEAEIDRLNHSPFDITNRNTFFGSIAYSLLPIMTTHQSSGISGMTTITTATSKAVASLTGSVYASGEGSNYSTTFGNCPNLAKIDAVGDIYCNAIRVSDTSTLYITPDDPTYQEVVNKSIDCDSEGNCSVIKDSNLALYITHCMNRESPIGVLDSNILDSLKKTSKLGSAAVIAGGIPIVGDIMSILDGIDELDPENQAWADSGICTNSPTNPYWDKEFKYYQRYLEDMRVLEDLGVPGTDVSARFMEEYYREHPLDESPSGYLARISGLSKDDAETVIALVEYYDFIKDYDPSSRIAMEGGIIKTATQIVDNIENEKNWHYENNNVDSHTLKTIIAQQNIIYADLRNRSYAV